jgi:hypothetical protein
MLELGRMTGSQILAIALASVPTMITVLIGILINNARLGDVNARLGDLRHYIDARFNQVDQRFDEVDRRFDRVDGRFEEMKDLWRSELHRVEEVLDARLKHLEER